MKTDTIKGFVNGMVSTINEVAKESAEFRAQEKPCAKPEEDTQPETAPPVSPAYAILVEQRNIRIECMQLAECIVKGLDDFPRHINIEPCSNAVALPVEKTGNNTYTVRLYKKDPLKEFRSTDFQIELMPELNRRMDIVREKALQEIDRALNIFTGIRDSLNEDFNDPVSPYCGDVYHYNSVLRTANRNYHVIYENLKRFLYKMEFFNLEDKGLYVEIDFFVD